jgi:DNA-binding IscR family transcriptional regulator
MLGHLAATKVGTAQAELAETLGLSLPLTKYHLGVLRCADLVVPTEGSGPGTTDRYVVSVAAS